MNSHRDMPRKYSPDASGLMGQGMSHSLMLTVQNGMGDAKGPSEKGWTSVSGQPRFEDQLCLLGSVTLGK